MRLAAATIAVIAVAAVLTGCSSTLDTSPTSTVSTRYDQVAAFQTRGYDKQLTRLTRVPSDSYLSMPWKVISLRDGGRVLHVRFISGGGGGANADIRNVGYWLRETSDSVELMFVSRVVRKSADRDAALGGGSTTIRLSHPLGRRTLLQAPLSAGWSDDDLS